MSKFVIKLIILSALLLAVDRIAGVILTNYNPSGKFDYIADYCKEDLLIFGSSRALNHYNAKMIQDSLGCSSFNCGESGNSIINSYCYLKMILKRHHPKVIIYDVATRFDFEKMDNHRFLRELKSKCYYNDIWELILKIDPSEKWKLKSYLYRFNSNWLHKPNKYIQDDYKYEFICQKGFKPIRSSFDELKINKSIQHPQEFIIDSFKISLLDDFIHLVDSNTKVVAIISPRWDGGDKRKIQFAENFFKCHNIPLYDFSFNTKYFHHKEYFSDPTHLNSIGADVFTNDVLKLLKKNESF